jgi:hypothetical protein
MSKALTDLGGGAVANSTMGIRGRPVEWKERESANHVVKDKLKNAAKWCFAYETSSLPQALSKMVGCGENPLRRVA